MRKPVQKSITKAEKYLVNFQIYLSTNFRVEQKWRDETHQKSKCFVFGSQIYKNPKLKMFLVKSVGKKIS